ncbi:MAG: DUF1934 family protein [Erysipelotrichaceae bacterium]|nr:DUF1934 family protein [Erysipelotrichaceae bacterium]
MKTSDMLRVEQCSSGEKTVYNVIGTVSLANDGYLIAYTEPETTAETKIRIYPTYCLLVRQAEHKTVLKLHTEQASYLKVESEYGEFTFECEHVKISCSPDMWEIMYELKQDPTHSPFYFRWSIEEEALA